MTLKTRVQHTAVAVSFKRTSQSVHVR